MDGKARGRRRFIKEGAALAGLAVGAVRSGDGQTIGSGASAAPSSDPHLYGERSHFEASVRSGVAPQAFTPLQDIPGIITPAPLHYVVSHGYFPPDIDPRQHRLLIHGLVDRPLIFTLDELKRLPSVTRVHFLECAGNTSPVEMRGGETIQRTHGWTSCSEWTGVPLSLLLKDVGAQKSGTWIVAEGSEPGKHSKSIPIEKAMDDVIVAYGQNGEAVRPEQGYPLRLVVPGFEGISNVKWLRRIKVVDEPYQAKSESTSYSVLRPNLKGKSLWFNFQLGPKSVITRPSGGQKLGLPGFYEIVGLAWSGAGAIRRVEVSTDGGRTWTDAHLQEPIYRMAHTRFRLPWNWNGGEVVLQSRCADEAGQVQPSMAEFARLWGVEPNYFQHTSNRVNHFNGIQPWRVGGDGSVHNALFS